MIEDIEKKNPYGLLGNLEVQICRGYLQHLSLHPDKQLNCGINHTKVMVSDKGPATLFYFFWCCKTIKQSFLSWFWLLLQNHMASHGTSSFHWWDPALFNFFAKLQCCSKANYSSTVNWPLFSVFPLQSMVICANQKFLVVYFIVFLFYHVYIWKKSYILTIKDYRSLLIKF